MDFNSGAESGRAAPSRAFQPGLEAAGIEPAGRGLSYSPSHQGVPPTNATVTRGKTIDKVCSISELRSERYIRV